MIDFVPDEKCVPVRVALVRLVCRSGSLHRRGGRVRRLCSATAPLHGVSSIGKSWRDCATGTVCIAVDYLGFGLSERPQNFGYRISEHTTILGELIDHLQLDGFVLMGQDWGGPIGLGTATERADRVRGIVLRQHGVLADRATGQSSIQRDHE